MRIILLGNAGAGKSTLAKSIMGAQAIPRLSLDEVAWDEPAVRKSLDQSLILLMAFINANENWILEGCYSDILETALSLCEELIFLNPGIDVCVEHCLKRPWEPDKFESSEQQNANLQNLVKWVQDYETRDDEYGLSRHRKLFDSFSGNKRELKYASEYSIQQGPQ